jgi:hypothetical protein
VTKFVDIFFQMNEPIVTHLYYELKLSSELDFDNPPPLESDLPDFKLILNAGQLEVLMNIEVSSEVIARSIVEPFLRSWELDQFLTTGRKEFWFEFKNSIIIDKSPTRPGDVVIHAGVGELVFLSDEISIKLTKKVYPPPEFGLTISPDVQTLLSRYEGFINKKEPLLSMAYFCLTAFEVDAGNRLNAANKFNIHYLVFKTLGELTSERGDSKESRKAREQASLQPLTSKEIVWINAAVRKLIRRKAEFDNNPVGKYSLIDMNSLPPL